MARSLNRVMLIGHLGSDPVLKDLAGGTPVCNFQIATSETWKDKQSGDRKERTEWHRVAVFGRLAEIAGEYLHKGSLVYVEGSLRTRKWQDKQGADRYSTEVIGSELVFLSSTGAPSGEQAASNDDAQQAEDASPLEDESTPF